MRRTFLGEKCKQVRIVTFMWHGLVNRTVFLIITVNPGITVVVAVGSL